MTNEDHVVRIGAEVHRKVAVTGSDSVSTTVVVVVRCGKVRLSIEPLFTWEAVVTPGKVDELIRTLESARDEASRQRP